MCLANGPTTSSFLACVSKLHLSFLLQFHGVWRNGYDLRETRSRRSSILCALFLYCRQWTQTAALTDLPVEALCVAEADGVG
jgi:hypothetical protein